MQTRIALGESRTRLLDVHGRICTGWPWEIRGRSWDVRSGYRLGAVRASCEEKGEPEQFVNTCAQCEKLGNSVPALCNVRIGLEIQTTGNAWEEMGNPECNRSSLDISGTCSERAGSMDPPIHFMPVYPGGHSEPTLSFKSCSIVQGLRCPPKNLQLYTETSTETLKQFRTLGGLMSARLLQLDP